MTAALCENNVGINTLGVEMRSMKGFTLVELLVTIAVLAIALGIALPGFTDLLRQNRAQAHATMLVSALSLARSEAVKRGGRVGVASAGGTTDWQGGWNVWVDANENNALDAGELLLRSFAALPHGLILTASANRVVFTATGVQLLSSGDVSFAYSVTGLDCRYGRVITVNSMGRVSLARACTS